jgi:hypothetical protein
MCLLLRLSAAAFSPQHLQRKKTLLVEYKQLRKANTFIDRRFGGEGSSSRASC